MTGARLLVEGDDVRELQLILEPAAAWDWGDVKLYFGWGVFNIYQEHSGAWTKYEAMGDTPIPVINGAEYHYEGKVISSSTSMTLKFIPTGQSDSDLEDWVGVTVVKVMISEIHFTDLGVGATAIPLKHHANGDIEAAQWSDTDSDRVPDEPWKNVGAWVKKRTTNPDRVRIKAKFVVTPSSINSIKVLAESTVFVNLYQPGTTDPVTISLTGGMGEGIFEFSADQTAIRCMKKEDWKWEWKLKEFDGDTANCTFAETIHDICITAGDPVVGADGALAYPVFKWVMLV